MFQNKKIFILGMARSGYEAAKVLAPLNTLLVTDMKEQDKEKVKELENMNVKVVITDKPDELLDNTYNYLVKNPGIKLNHPCVVKAESLKIPVINEVELAYHLLPKDVTIIGITGSNGKTTTTTLTYEFLKEAGFRVHLGGNIGTPLCALLKDVKEKDILVLEISGHQLHDMYDFKTNISVMTNLCEVHTDHFGSYENYKNNKAKIFNNHTEKDVAILNLENNDVLEKAKNIKSKKLYFSSKKEADACIKNNSIYYKDEKIIDISDIKIKGTHNLENIMCAILATKELGISNDAIKNVLTKFAGVEHRIEFVDKINNREFYNDSKATNVKSTTVALSAFTSPVILLLGGLDRNLPFDGLTDYLKYVKQIVCYGETKNKIKEFADKVNVPCIVVDSLDEAVKEAYDLSVENDTILLSPACASWDQFHDFEERGRKFKELVEKIKEEK